MLSQIKRASISRWVALGPRAGLKVRRIGCTFGFEEEIPKIQGYGCASMNGFSIHAATSIKAHERDRLEKLLRYLGRGPVSNEKISLDKEGNILYELKTSYDGATHVQLSPLEFIEKLSSIIPPAYKHQVNYYGCLSSHSKLRALVVVGHGEELCEDDALPRQDVEDNLQAGLDQKKKSNYIPWAELLKRTFGIDLTVCPCCQGRLQIISVIIQQEAAQKILSHMGLHTGPPAKQRSFEIEYA